MIKSIVIYHSITGNTKKIAEAIHVGMSRAGGQCDIARIKDIKTEDLKDYDLIGLGSPVMQQRELYNVTNFIELTMKGVDGKHAFSFCTHGATPGRYLARVFAALTQRGLTVVGWNDWFGSALFPGVPKPYFTDGHPDEIDLKEAEDFGVEMIDRSRRIYNGETQLIPAFPRGNEYDEIFDPDPMPSWEIIQEYRKAQAMMNFTVNKEKCKYPKCTFCIDNCPMGSIDFSEDPPLFNISCDKCYMCEQACPSGAIEVDWQHFHNSHLPLIPHLQKSLEIFEARGKFRRLVPLNEIGWNNYLWQKKSPRIKIV